MATERQKQQLCLFQRPLFNLTVLGLTKIAKTLCGMMRLSSTEKISSYQEPAYVEQVKVFYNPANEADLEKY